MSLADLGAITYDGEGPAPRAVFVFAHGAGSGQRHPFMVAIARALAARGIDVVTFDFPYMRHRKGAPDRPPVLEQSFRDVIDAARDWSKAGPLFIGGKSMGGRIATHLAAQQVPAFSGVLCFGYPLHPPGKPEQLRVGHFPAIAAPILIIQGERDAFGTPAELQRHIAQITCAVQLHVVERGDHSLTVRSRKPAEMQSEIAGIAADWMLNA